MLISKYIILYILIIISQAACKKFVDIAPAPDLIATEKIFTSEATALAAVSGVYVQMRETAPSLFNGSLSIYAALSADELLTSSTNLEYDIFQANSITPVSETVAYQLWTPAYQLIFRANSILENVERSNALPEKTKWQFEGEMKFVRAATYVYLVNVFGEVPLVLTSDYRDNEKKQRSGTDAIYDQVTTDLTSASDLLSETYPSTGKARPNKYAALALLARVQLYRGKWKEAEEAATKIIASGKYSLSPLEIVFQKNAPETIWEIASPGEQTNSVEGSTFVPASNDVIPEFFLTPTLLNSFETGDQRKLHWLGKNEVGSVEYLYPFKYKNRETSPVTEYTVMLRLAEQYLIRAEARAHRQNMGVAYDDVNTIRLRAGLTPLAISSQEMLLEAIAQERKVELFAEWGHRWFDLKRTGTINGVLGAVKGPNWHATDALYPIPQSEILINPFLEQNPGY